MLHRWVVSKAGRSGRGGVFRVLRSLTVALLVSCLAGCAALTPSLQEPVITLNAFRPMPSNTMALHFMIDLHIVNPNDLALKVKGLTYSASIEGHRVLFGASAALPEIPAYGETDISLQASTGLLEGLKLLTELLAKPRQQVSYEVSVNMDVGTLFPMLKFEESGSIQLGRRSGN